MEDHQLLQYLRNVIKNLPSDWLDLTTHRLDIYNEDLAKTEFLAGFERLYAAGNADPSALQALPTAYDYIRLGHPLSSVLEWAIAQWSGLKPAHVISFSSKTAPILAVLRKNLFDQMRTRIVHTGQLPSFFDLDTVRRVYGYHFLVQQVRSAEEISAFEGTTVFVAAREGVGPVVLHPHIDFFVGLHGDLGSILVANAHVDASYIPAIQHVRRRETIAMTPAHAFAALQLLTENAADASPRNSAETARAEVLEAIGSITGARSGAVLGSSGLSVQYAVMMGLIDHAMEYHPGKDIRIIVPPNCYGGTNDQARRVAACIEGVEIMDLLVDGDNDMVDSTNRVLDQVAREDAIPFIIAEIPTNPRVEVPDLEKLKNVLVRERLTSAGEVAIAPVFILDQTFCPNVPFLASGGAFASVRTVSYVSGSKFPSGGKCTAGYCVANAPASDLMEKIQTHLSICDNGATAHQLKVLAQQLPSMNRRIQAAYENTRAFVRFIEEVLPAAKINFVTDALAREGFTPSVFSLDLPTKGSTEEEREAYKRAMNHKLIHMMITQIPDQSKYCVSYGQLKGCYWTIPATSTQGTTKEADKDYIARVSVSPDFDLERHKKVFLDFVAEM